LYDDKLKKEKYKNIGPEGQASMNYMKFYRIERRRKETYKKEELNSKMRLM
jgi:hypothetical protein